MPVFHYEALDAKGNATASDIEALSNREAISKIRNKGYYPTKVYEKGGRQSAAPAKTSASRRGANARVKAHVLCDFAREFSTLHDAGLSILRSLRMLEKQQPQGSFRRILGYVADDIEGGATLSEAFGRYPRCFNKLFVSMVAAGEAGGVLDVVLCRLADFMEKSEKLKARIKSAMIYPVVVISVAFMIVMGLMIFVMPRFSSVLKELTGKELPWLTQTLMDFSTWMQGGGWAIIIGGILAVILVTRLVKATRVGRIAIDHVSLRVPVMGQIVSKSSIARWSRTLGTLLGAGVPILDAIRIAADTAGNAAYADVLVKANSAIRQGDTFAGPLRACSVIDPMVVNMIDVGEETGDLDKMMHKIADRYDEKVDVLVSSMMSLLEPAIVLVLGAIVLVIVLAVFLPIVVNMPGMPGA
jgi:type IV pilus assembly protein PilC